MILSQSGLRDYFLTVIGSDCVKEKKPHPEAAYLALNKLQAQAQQTIMVGDTVHDMQLAQNAGLTALAVSYGIDSESTLKSLQPYAVCDSFSEVVEIICQLDLKQGVAV